MYYKIFIFILAFIIPNVRCSDNAKIKGGRAARAGEYPFIGQLIFLLSPKDAKLCGCALVTVDKVVTAGHCIMAWENGRRTVYDVDKGTVYFGTLHFMGDDAQTSKVKSLKYPNEIRKKASGGIMHDYATVSLISPLTLSDTVKLLPIYSVDKTEFKNGWDEMVASRVECQIIGWGATNFRIENDTVMVDSASQYLKTARARPWEEQKCERYGGPPSDNMVRFGEICLLGVRHGDTALPGDSGSPLLCGDYVWAVCSSMFIDDTGRMPFHYLLHWHYLNDYLYTSGASGLSIYAQILFLQLFIILFRESVS